MHKARKIVLITKKGARVAHLTQFAVTLWMFAFLVLFLWGLRLLSSISQYFDPFVFGGLGLLWPIPQHILHSKMCPRPLGDASLVHQLYIAVSIVKRLVEGSQARVPLVLAVLLFNQACDLVLLIGSSTSSHCSTTPVH